MYKIISTQSSFEAEIVVSDERRLLTPLPSHFNSYFPSPGVSRFFEEYCNEYGEYNLKSSVETYNESPCFDNFCKLLNVLADFLYDQDQRPWIAGYENYYFYNLEDRISDSIKSLMIELSAHLENYSRSDFLKYKDFLTSVFERFDLVSLKLESKERNSIEDERFSSFSTLKGCFQIKIQELNTPLVDDVDVYTEPETKHMASTTASTGVRRTDHVVITVVAESKEKEEVVVDKELAVRQVKNRILKSILFFDEEDLRKPQSTRENSLFTFMHWVRSMLTKSMLWKNGLDVATFIDGLRIMAEHEQFYEGNFTRTMSAIHLSEHGSESFDTGDLKAKLDQFDAENQRIYAQKVTLAQLWDEDGVEFMRGKWTWLSSVMRSWFDNSGAPPSYKDFLSASDIEALNSGKKLSLHQLESISLATKAVNEDNINNRVDSYSNFQSLGSIIAFNGAIDFGMREIGGYVDQFNNFQWQQVVSQNIQYCLVHAVHKEIDRVLNLSSVSTEDCVKKKEQIDVLKQGFDLLIETLEQDKQRQLDELEKLQIQYDSQAKITQRDQLRELRDQMLMMSRSLDVLKAKQETYFSILDEKSHTHVFNEEKRSLSDLKQSITYKFQNQKSQLIKQLVLEAKKIDDLEDKEGVGFEASSRLKKELIRAQIIIPEVDISEAKKERYKPVRLFNSEGIGEDFYLLKSDLEILVEEKVLHPYLAGYQLSVNGTGLLELNQHDSRQSERYARSIAHLEVVSSTGSSFSVTDSVKNIVQRSTSTFVTETETEKEKREDYTLNLRQAKRLDAENAIGSVVDFLARIGIEFDNLNDTLPENISEIVMPDEYSIDTMPLSLSLVENPYSNHINNSFLRLFNNWGATVGNAGNVMWRSFFSGVSAYGLLGMAPVFALRLISMASLATSLTRLFTTVFPVLGNIPGFQNLALAADSVIGINNSWLMLLALVPNLTKTFSSGHHQFSNVQEAYNLGQSVFYGGTKALPGVFDWTNSIWSYVKDLPKQSYLSTSWDLIATVASVGMGVYGFGTGATVLAGLFRAGVALGFTSRLLDFSSLLSNLKDESKSYSISSFFKGIAHHLVYSIQSPAIFAILKLYVAFYTFHMFYLSKTTWDYFFRQVYSGVTAQSLPDFDGLNGGPMSSFIFNRSIEEGASIFDKPFDVPALRGMPLPGAPISAYIILFNFLGAGFSGLSAISNSGMYALSKTKQGIMGCLGYEDSSNDVYRAACWSAFKERSQTSINEVFYKSSSLFIDYKRVGQIWNTSQTWYQGLGRIAKHYVWSGIRDRLFSQSIEARDKASVFTHLASIAYDNVVEKGIKKPANNLVADFQHSKGIQKAWPIAKVASNLALPMLYLYSQYQAGKYENVSGLKLDTAQRVTREGLTAFICSPYGAFVLSNFIKEFTNFPMGMTSTSIMAGMSIPNFRAYAEAKLDRGESTILGSPEGAIRFAISLVAICDFINMFHDHHNLAHWYDAVVLGKDRSVEAVRKVKLEISK